MSEPDRLIAITVAAVCLLIGLFGMLVFPDARSKWRALLTVLTSTVVALGLRTVGAGASIPVETPYLLVLLIVIAGVGCWTTGGFHRTTTADESAGLSHREADIEGEDARGAEASS